MKRGRCSAPRPSLAELFLGRRIGERRAGLWHDGGLVAMQVARAGDGAVAGSRWGARLLRRTGPRGIARLPGGEEVLVEPWPTQYPEGALAEVEIMRQAWPEPGRPRLARARSLGPAIVEGPLGADADPFAPLRALADHIRSDAWPAEVAEAWDTAWEEAALGRVRIAGGSLHFTPTPAFVAVDVDGTGAGLAVDAAAAVARYVRLWGLGGGVVVDLPVRSRAERQAAADAIDSGLAGQGFERTAVNGFGLLQIVLPRRGPSILERARLQPEVGAALALLAAAVAEPRAAPGLDLVAAPAVAQWLDRHPELMAEAAAAAGRPLRITSDRDAGTGHVASRP